MEGYTENGSGTDVTDQIGFAGMRRKKKQRRGLSVFQLKVIGAVALVLSAGSTTLVPLIFGSDTSNMTSLTAMVLCEVVSWFAAPIYAWLLVQGFQQTRNRVAYGVQLLLLALIAEVPYDLATSGKPFDFGSQNPVSGLFIAFAMLAAMKWVAQRYQGAMLVISDIVLVVVAVLWDLLLRVGLRQHLMSLGAVTLGFVLIFWLMRSRENTMMFTAGLFGAVMMIAPGVGVAFVHYYNGKLGYKHSWTKWMFYAFYPVILLICAAVA